MIVNHPKKYVKMGGKSFNVYLKTFLKIYKNNIKYVQDYDREQRGQN
jgi:hypothetical protein